MKKIISCLFVALLSLSLSAQTAGDVQHTLDSLQKNGNFPGLSLAIVYADNTRLALTAGYVDREKETVLKVSDRLLMGSVGKTYVAAIAMKLIQKNKIGLDDPVSKYLGHLQWFHRIPNAQDITIRMIMNHTSGIMRYEFKEAFTKALMADVDKKWRPAELLSFVLDEKPLFKAGEGWEYSDTNYIILGMIIEEVSGKDFYKMVDKEILKPLGLHETFPSNSRRLPGLAQGYAGEGNEFGGTDKVINERGSFVINPQFEWTGGGFYATTQDLALWAKYLYEGKAFDPALLNLMLDGVPAKLGKDAKYGLGVIIKPSPLGVAYGHSGFFPGYLTEMFYFPEHKMSIALQANSSDFKKIKGNLWRYLLTLAAIAKKTT